MGETAYYVLKVGGGANDYVCFHPDFNDYYLSTFQNTQLLVFKSVSDFYTKHYKKMQSFLKENPSCKIVEIKEVSFRNIIPPTI